MKNIDAAGIFKHTTKTTKCVAVKSEYIVNSVTKYPLRIPVLTIFLKLLKRRWCYQFSLRRRYLLLYRGLISETYRWLL